MIVKLWLVSGQLSLSQAWSMPRNSLCVCAKKRDFFVFLTLAGVEFVSFVMKYFYHVNSFLEAEFLYGSLFPSVRMKEKVTRWGNRGQVFT